MRILHVVDGIPPATLGGTGRIVMEIASAQRKRGHQVAVLSAAGTGELPASIDGVELLTVEPRSERWAHWRAVFSRSRERQVLGHIRTFRPDVVHAHTISRQCGYRWMPGVKADGAALVVTCHDVSHVAYGKVFGTETSLWLADMRNHRWGWNPLRNVLIRRYLRCADRILAVSDALRVYLERCGITGVTTLHNGIDLEYWKPGISRAEARKALKLPENGFLFLLAGRMGWAKGSTLVAATLPNEAGLVLAGDRFSDEFARIKERMHIYFNQSADDMKLHYAAADAVLVPSRCLDCFPTVCLEAMALERPVLATSWGGAKESVKDGETGWIIDPMDEPAWAERMCWCIGHPAELEAAGKAGLERMRKHFGIVTMCDALDKIYAAALAGR